MGRRGGGSNLAPSRRAAPPTEFEDETVSEWLRHQTNPIKPPLIATTRALYHRHEVTGSRSPDHLGGVSE